MKTLVTGGAGFMGSHVSESLIKEGHDVHILDDLSGGFEENVPEKAKFIKGSVTDETLIKKLFSKNNYEYIYHLAAYAAEGLSHFIRRFNYQNNLIGSTNLINAAVRNNVKCIVFTSSIAVYGAGDPPFTEKTTPDPEDPYGIAKYGVEMDLEAARNMWDLNYIIFRPHNVYGERQNLGDKYRNVVGIFMNQVMQDKNLTIFGDGEQTRAFTHISDVAPLIAKSVQNNDAYNEIFNIGSDKQVTVNQLAEVILEVMGESVEIKHLPARNEVKHAFASHDKLKNFFDYKPKTELKEGIGKMADWAKKTGIQETSEFGKLEISKNLPSIWKD